MSITKKNKQNTRKKNIKLTKESNNNIMEYLNAYSHLMNVNMDNDKFINLIYNSLINSKKQSKKINYVTNVEPLEYLQLASSFFLDKTILANLRKTLDYVCKTHVTIMENFHFAINVYYNHSMQSHIKNVINKIIFVLCFCLQHFNDNKTINKFSINLYLGNDNKNVIGFSNKIEPKHINSGYYYYDPQTETSNITIFRKEEWFKTLIHECVHCFNLDFKSSKINFTSLFGDLFYVKSTYIVNEAFTEFWARIINCAMISYFSLFVPTKSTFKELFILNLNIERCFSMYQSYKLLKLFGLEYYQIIDKTNQEMTKKIYTETTNAFCYYVITSILMFNFDKTLKWFTNENYNSIIFNKTERQIMIFCYYFKGLAKSDELLKLYEEINKNDVKHRTMRMTIFELEY